MRVFLPITAAVLLSACSETPVVKTPEKPPEPVSGVHAFYQTYPQARAWALDAQPVRVRSIELNELKAIGGTGGGVGSDVRLPIQRPIENLHVVRSRSRR